MSAEPTPSERPKRLARLAENLHSQRYEIRFWVGAWLIAFALCIADLLVSGEQPGIGVYVVCAITGWIVASLLGLRRP